MAVKLSPVYNEATLDTNGNPWSGAQLFTYVAGSSTKQTTYKDSAAGTPHTNPIILNARGEPPSPIWITSGVTYKFVLASPTESDPPVSPTRSVDNISGVNDTTSVLDQWIAGAAPTYVSATSFTLVGDQTSTYHAGRRLKTTNTGGTVYSTITASAFGVVTTITVLNDSGTLDSGLSAVSYGLLTATNTSLPITRGTWTPALGGSTTYTVQAGTYVKIDRMVFVAGQLTINAIGSGSTFSVSGLPFAAAIGDSGIGVSSSGTLASSVVSITGSIISGTSAITMRSRTAAATADGTNALFGNGTQMSFSGWYQAAT